MSAPSLRDDFCLPTPSFIPGYDPDDGVSQLSPAAGRELQSTPESHENHSAAGGSSLNIQPSAAEQENNTSPALCTTTAADGASYSKVGGLRINGRRATTAETRAHRRGHIEAVATREERCRFLINRIRKNLSQRGFVPSAELRSMLMDVIVELEATLPQAQPTNP